MSLAESQRITRVESYLHVWQSRLVNLPADAESTLRTFYLTEVELCEKKLVKLRKQRGV